MPKYELIENLYEETVQQLTDPENWNSFLRTACYNFKLPFDEQVLVFAQRPDSKALLTLEKWNTRYGYWVNRGAKGIAVFDKEVNEYPKLKYYFDISDIHPSRYSKEIPLWSVKPEYSKEIIETLELTFGELKQADTLKQALSSAVYNAVEDNIQDYFLQLKQCYQGSCLENRSEQNTFEMYKNLLNASITSMLLFRCGLENTEINDCFNELHQFNTPQVFNALGIATSDIAAMGLSEIAKTVRSIQTKSEYTFAKTNKTNYAKDVKERSKLNETGIHDERWNQLSQPFTTEGGSDNDGEIRSAPPSVSEKSQTDHLHESVDNSEVKQAPQGNRGNGTEAENPTHPTDETSGGSVRNPQRNQSNGMGEVDEQHTSTSGRNDTQRSDLQLENYDRMTEDKSLPFFHDENKIKKILLTTLKEKQLEKDLLDYFAKPLHEKNYEFVRTIFEVGIIEMNLKNNVRVGYKPYENVLHLWEGNYTNRESEGYYDWGVIQNYYLGMVLLHEIKEDVFQTNEGQLSLFEDKILLFPQEIIDYVLQCGSSISQGKYRIYQHFQKNLSVEDNIKFLKNEYGIGGHSPILAGTGIQEFHDSNGIRLTKSFSNESMLLSWKQAAIRIKTLIQQNRYLTFEEKNQIEEIQANQDEIQTIEITDSSLKNSNEETIVIDEAAKTEIIDTVTPQQYHYRAEKIFTGAKEKYQANIKAIKVIKNCEEEERYATLEEQEILAGYSGWGSLPMVFEDENSSWFNEHNELKSLLSTEEYQAARESTLTAFFTPIEVINAMYSALEQMGFKQGNVLEPSCGTGRFIGAVPESLAEAKFYGVELDSITGKIAKYLYPKSNISIQGFENKEFPDSIFDVAIGNVPFADFKVLDKRYDKYNWLIHDYFFGKTMDKIRSGGILAFITSKGTMDKENSSFRKYIAQRAELIGAIRLPNDTFKNGAGTKVTSDIIFLQKRDRIVDVEPEWIFVGTNDDGIKMNQYFIDHPEMILGEMVHETAQFGIRTTCKPYENADLSEQLKTAITHLHAEITEYDIEDLEESEQAIPADPNVRNFSFTLVEDKLYFRENSRMIFVNESITATNRIKGMIELRECVRKLIVYQSENVPDQFIDQEQKKLNELYDNFTAHYGLINSRGNQMAFGDDSSYFLLCSLEILDEEGNFKRKADMFYKRTIRSHVPVTHVDTSVEALSISIAERAKVDLEFMSKLTGKEADTIESDLIGIIFRDIQDDSKKEISDFPLVTASEYLSGNVRKKLAAAKAYNKCLPVEKRQRVQQNIEALEKVQPPNLTAAEIGVRIGATWIPPEVYEDFMFTMFSTGYSGKHKMKILYSKATGEWNITNKNSDYGNIKATTTFGTSRMNAYTILEQTLNLKDVRIFDTIYENDGEKRVLNKKETAIAQDRQELIKSKFNEWIFKDLDRRERLCQIYNELFNCIRPREYDGSHLIFPRMNPEIKLRNHQVNAIAHILYGGNTLLAHQVGAGKTYEMVAAAMESKRLGLCTKSLVVVPNHITEQWASEWLQLYPAANILVATKKDFQTKNRKKFCARIATGDYDAVIIGHSQFEKIPVSKERQERVLRKQIQDILNSITEARKAHCERYTIKQMERSKKQLEVRLRKLNDQSRKDDVVNFEELGIDRIFIDESHYFKNLFLMTKMRNVGGIAQSEAQKSSDLFMKTQYLDELTGGKGVVFATGTPISNSMVVRP